MSFLDEVTIKVQSGKGGSGCLSFASSRRRVFGGPDGGDGGRGGSVWVRVNSKKLSLSHLGLRKTYKALSGSSGQSQKRKGKKGEDLILDIPPDTQVTVDQKTFYPKTNHLLLKGGRGGRGNFFFKTSTQPSPRKFEKGEAGKSTIIHLEMKLKVDVALIGWCPIHLQKEFLKLKGSKILFSHSFPRVHYSFFADNSCSLVEIPYLKKGKNFLKHALSSKVLIFVLMLKEWNQCKTDYENILETLKNFHSSFLKKKKVGFLIMDYCLSKKEQEKAFLFFKQQKLHIFEKFNPLEKFIEQNI